jgi:cytochrome c peroxidase
MTSRAAMLRPTFAAALVLLAAACAGEGDARPPAAGDERAARVHASVLAGMDSLEAAVARLGAASASAAPAEVQRAFREARLAYKRVEPLVEMYAPTTAELINGPALDEVEEDDPNRFVLRAEGFQVIEERLFPEVDPAGRAEVAEEVAILRANVRRARGMLASTPLTDAAVFDALRQQIARATLLGLAGFDAPLAATGVRETAESFRAVRAALAPYRASDRWREADGRLARAVTYLEAHPDFDSFDRLTFLREHANPAARALWRLREGLGIAAPEGRLAWRGLAATPWERDAFDALAFAPGSAEAPVPARVELGRTLFFDPILSGDGRRACASCHAPEKGFADGLARSLPTGATRGAVLRNAPTLVNAGLQAATFYDLRTTFLEDQVADVVSNPDEMHGDFAAVARRLGGSPEYVARFGHAFAGGGVDERRVRAAVAAYVRSLQRLDSRFDREVRGEPGGMDAAERRGFNLFMGRAKCGTCHFAPLFNGTVPPAYTEAEVEVLGVPAAPATRSARVDPDPGRARVTRIELHQHAFKTPTVRNVALTAPYMHNGVYRTLEEVVDFYDRGGGAGIGIGLANQTLPPDALKLSKREKSDLVAFMRALTDTTGLTARPAVLPRFPHTAHLDRRPIGGAY